MNSVCAPEIITTKRACHPVKVFLQFSFLIVSLHFFGVSHASLVTYNFSGTVDYASPGIGSTITPGQSLTGFYAFYTDTPGSYNYLEPFASATIRVGSHRWNLGMPTPLLPNAISILDSGGGTDGYDGYDVQIIPSGPSIRRYDPKRFGITVYDNTGSLFNNSSLRRNPPNIYIVPQENRYWKLEFEGGKWVGGSLTSLTFGDSRSEAKPTAYLLLHGLNSDPAEAWDTLVRRVFGNRCTTVRYNDVNGSNNIIPKDTCYRYHFKTRTVDGENWNNGDGANYSELGYEVGQVIDSIVHSTNPRGIVLVGHSRGGLAARAYLQEYPYFGYSKIGLLTIGTPHQGSPLGRIKHWMDANGFVNEIGRIRFLYSPSTGYLATDHDENGKPIRSAVSEAIWTLNDEVSFLDDNVAVFGQIVSFGLILGDDIVGSGNILDGATSILTRLILPPGDYFDNMKQFVLHNIAEIQEDGNFCSEQDKSNANNWACNGDGLVPFISQRLSAIPGFDRGSKPIFSGILNGVAHTSETSEWSTIKDMLKEMTQEDGFKPLD